MLRRGLLRGVFLVLALGGALAGCGGAERTPTPSPGASAILGGTIDLDGSEWTLTELNGASLLPGTNITLSFEEDRAAGFASCNAYGGTYKSGGDGVLTVSMLERTLQACLEPEGVMEQEDAYLAALQEAAAYRVEDDRLEVEDGTGKVVLVYGQQVRAAMDPGDLLGTAWQLVSLDGAGPVKSSIITLVFDGEGQASGVAGCREYAVDYEATEDKISFPMISMSGDDDCLADEALYQQEGDYTDALTWATNFRLGEGRLEIETARGEVLAFEVMDDEPVVSPEQGGAGQDACAEYLHLVVYAGGDKLQTVVSCYQCDGVHVDSTGQSPDSASLSVMVDTPLRLHFGADVLPDSIVARVYAGTGVSASFFRWPEELPGGAEPVAMLDVVAVQSLRFEPKLTPDEYSVVIQAAWDGDIEVFYAFSLRIG